MIHELVLFCVNYWTFILLSIGLELCKEIHTHVCVYRNTVLHVLLLGKMGCFYTDDGDELINNHHNNESHA